MSDLLRRIKIEWEALALSCKCSEGAGCSICEITFLLADVDPDGEQEADGLADLHSYQRELLERIQSGELQVVPADANTGKALSLPVIREGQQLIRVETLGGCEWHVPVEVAEIQPAKDGSAEWEVTVVPTGELPDDLIVPDGNRD